MICTVQFTVKSVSSSMYASWRTRTICYSSIWSLFLSGVMSLWYDSYFYSSSKISASDNQILVAVLAYCTILEVIIFYSNCTFFIS